MLIAGYGCCRLPAMLLLQFYFDTSLLGTETLTVCDFGCGWIVLCLCQGEKSAKFRVKRKSFLDRKKCVGGSGRDSESDPIPPPEAGKGTFPVNVPGG